ncbi:MAG: hypothetical protein QOH42_744 [Blastocatellia bacterium]|nr:hypothetical protein [Blastocatellia bacterium]
MEHPESRNDTPEQSLEAAQLEKLNLEIRALRKKSAWRDTVLQLTPALTVLVALSGFVFGIYQFHNGQEKAREFEQAGQRIKIQDQIRSDLDQIVQFTADKKQTVSRVSFLLLDLDNLLKPNPGDPDSTAKDRRKISDLLVQLMCDDTDLNERRNVSFALTLVKQWSDYGESLKAHPNMLANILTNHCDAFEGIYKKAPKYFGRFKYTDQTKSEIDEPDVKPIPDASLARHFEDLVGSYSRHLELIQDASTRQSAIKHFQMATCNRDLTQQEFGESFDPKQNPSDFGSCSK